MARKLAIYLPDLSGGGVERMRLALIPHFQKAGYRVEVLLHQARGALLSHVPPDTHIINLDASRSLAALPKLIVYLQQQKPDVLLSALPHNNIIACYAKFLTQSPTRLVISQHNALAAEAKNQGWKFQVLPWLMRHTHNNADAIVAVSQGIAEELAALCAIDRSRISVIYNPIIDDHFSQRAAAPCSHPWLQPQEPPVIVAAGRLTAQKDFATLLRAFALVRAAQPVRLLILGEGDELFSLQNLIITLGLTGCAELTGYVASPLPYMARAALCVLSSRYEGFGNVLVESLACGTPVVSTDCPYGPAEICADLPYPALCQIGDVDGLAARITACLHMSVDRDALKQHGMTYTAAHSAQSYLRLF